MPSARCGHALQAAPPVAQVPGCAACGTAPIITRASLPAYDYAAFTGAQPNDAAPPQLHLLPDAQRLSPHALRTALRGSTDALVVDVRPRQHFDIAHIPGMAASWLLLRMRRPKGRMCIEWHWRSSPDGVCAARGTCRLALVPVRREPPGRLPVPHPCSARRGVRGCGPCWRARGRSSRGAQWIQRDPRRDACAVSRERSGPRHRRRSRGYGAAGHGCVSRSRQLCGCRERLQHRGRARARKATPGGVQRTGCARW